MGEDLFDQVRVFLPKYLTPEDQRQLFEALETFPDNRDFFLSDGAVSDEFLQGDGWQGLVVINFDSLEKKAVSGLILSNSCDIAPENHRTLPVSVLFAPLIPFQQYAEVLRLAGKSSQQVEDTLASLRTQRVTSALYLPNAPYGVGESIVLLDDIHSQPLESFFHGSRRRLFRLNQYGFYILLIKLSIHFSRFQEGVRRMST